jgi:hypothetical protein
MRRQEFILSGELQRAALAKFVSTVNLDKPLRVTIEENKKRRSLSQMGLYWKWVNEVADKVADFTGHTSDEIHTIFKQKFLSPRVITLNGHDYAQYTTTKLTIGEMADYMTRVYEFVTTELGVIVSLPEEQLLR